MLGLTLLLNNAAQTLDRLGLLRMARDSDVLTPEYRDPNLTLRLDGQPCDAQARLQAQLVAMATQLRAVGPTASVSAILARAEPPRRLAALLALTAAGPWEQSADLPHGGQLHRRAAADGQIYLLAGQPDRGAAHAPHAARGYAERLWILPTEHACADGHALPAEPAALAADGPDSLSLQAARRDLMLELAATGHAALADRLATPHQPLPLPAAAPLERRPAAA
jgi:hypothetical protein